MIVLFRFTQSTFISRTLLSADRFGVWVASFATRQVFQRDTIRYAILTDSVFFDVVLVLATGFQTAVVGACVGLLFRRRGGSLPGARTA
jgi:hypothetical protein